MKNSIQLNTFDRLSTSKGFGIVQIIAIVAVLVLGGVYVAQKGSKTTDVAAPTITLVSPNGGEALIIGSSTPVSFTTTGEIKDGYQVVIWLEEGAAPLATIGATTTSYSLTIPESVLIGGDAVAPLEAGSYKIRVALYDGVPCTGHCLPTDVKELASDSSDGEVKIGTSSTAALKLSMKDWKIYTDTKNKFSFKYPSDYTAAENDGDGSSPEITWIHVYCSEVSPVCAGKSMSIYVFAANSARNNVQANKLLQNNGLKYEFNYIAPFDKNIGDSIVSSVTFTN
ncbi:MAG: hypothetical protein AAB381_01915 [Patescibacteria group bacterium]